MLLQGAVHHHDAVMATSEGVLRSMSGNSLNFFNQAQALMCALAVLDIEWLE